MLNLFPFLLALYEIVSYLANDMYVPALPNIMQDLHTSAHLSQMTLTVWFLGSVSLQLVTGPLSDRFGRKPIIMLSGIVFLIATAICALTNDIWVLLIARFFQGCVVSAIVTAGYAGVHESFDQKRAIHLIAIMSSMTILAPAFGPLVGGILLEWMNWRWIFGVLFFAGILAIGLLGLWMPETNLPANRHPFHWRQICRNTWAVLTNRTFLLFTLPFCFTFYCMIVWITAGPFFVIQKFGHSAVMFGVYQSIIFGCLMIGAYGVKALMNRMSVYAIIRLSFLVIMVGGIGALMSAILFPNSLIGLMGCLMIITLGSGFSFSPSQRLAIESSSEPMGTRLAVFATLIALAGALGSLIVSLTYTGSIMWFAINLAVAVFMGTIIAFMSTAR